MTNLRLRPPIVALTACLALTSMPSRLLAAPPEPTVEPAPPQLPKPAKRKLITGGTLIGLGFALELTGAVISSRCTAGEWCSRGFAVAFGPEAGPNRYTMVSTGPSSTYVIGRIAATPMLIGGFTLAMVGVAGMRPRMSTWTAARKRAVAWSLLGSGLGVLVVSAVLRGAFLAKAICQDALCAHGLDQTTLWVGRGLTFAGAGVLVQGAARRTELGMSGGPANSFGVSFDGRF